MKVLTQELKIQIIDNLILYVNKHFVEKKKISAFGHDLNSSFCWRINESPKDVKLALEILHAFPGVLYYWKGDYTVLLGWLEKSKVKTQNPYSMGFSYTGIGQDEGDKYILYLIYASFRTFEDYINGTNEI